MKPLEMPSLYSAVRYVSGFAKPTRPRSVVRQQNSSIRSAVMMRGFRHLQVVKSRPPAVIFKAGVGCGGGRRGGRAEVVGGSDRCMNKCSRTLDPAGGSIVYIK